MALTPLIDRSDCRQEIYAQITNENFVTQFHSSQNVPIHVDTAPVSLTINQYVTSHITPVESQVRVCSIPCLNSKTTNERSWFLLLRVDFTNNASCKQCRSRLINTTSDLYCRLRETGKIF